MYNDKKTQKIMDGNKIIVCKLKKNNININPKKHLIYKMENNDNTQSTPKDLSSPPTPEPNSSSPQIEQIEIIPQSKHSGPSMNFQDKPRKITVLISCGLYKEHR